jgi:hypothetical protein
MIAYGDMLSVRKTHPTVEWYSAISPEACSLIDSTRIAGSGLSPLPLPHQSAIKKGSVLPSGPYKYIKGLK